MHLLTLVSYLLAFLVEAGELDLAGGLGLRLKAYGGLGF
jgi:hypothetical protein